ncbi:MAG: hypothetical protein U0903_05700 [Planctomycetales bacterium]
MSVDDGLELWGDRTQVAIAVGVDPEQHRGIAGGGEIRIEGRKLSLGGKGTASISVLDQGKG